MQTYNLFSYSQYFFYFFWKFFFNLQFKTQNMFLKNFLIAKLISFRGCKSNFFFRTHNVFLTFFKNLFKPLKTTYKHLNQRTFYLLNLYRFAGANILPFFFNNLTFYKIILKSFDGFFGSTENVRVAKHLYFKKNLLDERIVIFDEWQIFNTPFFKQH